MSLKPCIVNALSMPRSVGHGRCSLCQQPIVPGFRHLDLENPTELRFWEFLDTRPAHPSEQTPAIIAEFTARFSEWCEIRQKYEVKIVMGMAFDHNARKSTKKHMAPLTGRR